MAYVPKRYEGKLGSKIDTKEIAGWVIFAAVAIGITLGLVYWISEIGANNPAVITVPGRR